MPLINITTSAKFHPYAGTSRQDPNREMIIKLAMALPRLMVNNLPDLRLDPTTMELAVQVTLQKFHPRSVHTPDVWIKVQFSEDGLTEKQRKKVAKKSKKILAVWFKEQGLDMPDGFAVDLLWGPTHGFIVADGLTVEW